MRSKVWDEITYLFPNFNGYTAKVREWISNIPHFLIDVITYPCRDEILSISVKGLFVVEHGLVTEMDVLTKSIKRSSQS